MKHLRTQVTQDLGGASCLKVAKTVHSFFITCSTDGLGGGEMAELSPRSTMKSSAQPARLHACSAAPWGSCSWWPCCLEGACPSVWPCDPPGLLTGV